MKFLIVLLLMQFVLGCGSGNFKTDFTQLIASSQEQPTEPTEIITSFSTPQDVLSLTIPISDFSIEKKNDKSYFYLITENDNTPKVDDPNWSQTAPTTYTFSNEDKCMISGSKVGLCFI